MIVCGPKTSPEAAAARTRPSPGCTEAPIELEALGECQQLLPGRAVLYSYVLPLTRSKRYGNLHGLGTKECSPRRRTSVLARAAAGVPHGPQTARTEFSACSCTAILASFVSIMPLRTATM